MRNAGGDCEIRLSNGDSNTIFNVLNAVGVLKSRRMGPVTYGDRIKYDRDDVVSIVR